MPVPDPVPAGRADPPDPRAFPAAAVPLAWSCLCCGHTVAWTASDAGAQADAYRRIDTHLGSCAALNQTT